MLTIPVMWCDIFWCFLAAVPIQIESVATYLLICVYVYMIIYVYTYYVSGHVLANRKPLQPTVSMKLSILLFSKRVCQTLWMRNDEPIDSNKRPPLFMRSASNYDLRTSSVYGCWQFHEQTMASLVQRQTGKWPWLGSCSGRSNIWWNTKGNKFVDPVILWAILLVLYE